MNLQRVRSQEELGASVREFAARELTPLAEEFGERSVVCRPIVEKIAAAGLFRTVTLEAGESWVQRARWTAHCTIREALAIEDSQSEEIYTIQCLGLYPIVLMGTAEQRAKWVPALLSGERLAAFALTEPDAGSDTSRLQMTARHRGNDWVLNGEKVFISHAPDADVYVVFACTELGSGGRTASAFVVEKGTPGFELGGPLDLLSPHAIGTLRFRNCEIPSNHLLGEEGKGLRVALSALELFRPSVGARAVGLSRRGLNLAMAWARERVVFGRPLIEQQVTAFTFAEMAMRIQAARAVVYAASARADRGEGIALEGSIAKALATETAQWVVYHAQQLFGARGVVRGHPAERLYRQARAMTIYEGTSEIQRLVIARELVRRQPDSYWNF